MKTPHNRMHSIPGLNDKRKCRVREDQYSKYIDRNNGGYITARDPNGGADLRDKTVIKTTGRVCRKKNR